MQQFPLETEDLAGALWSPLFNCFAIWDSPLKYRLMVYSQVRKWFPGIGSHKIEHTHVPLFYIPIDLKMLKNNLHPRSIKVTFMLRNQSFLVYLFYENLKLYMNADC